MRALAALAAVVAAVAVLAVPGVAGAQELKPPGTVAGFVYEKWAAAAIARAYAQVPGTVTNCQEGQSRKLWFLRGRGADGVVNCTVPFGTPIFFSGPWTACTDVEPFPWYAATDAEAAECAQRYNRRYLRSVGMTINGRKVYGLSRFLITTSPFDVVVGPENLFGVPAGPVRGVGQGYFFYLAPPPRGVHEIVLNTWFEPDRVTTRFRVTVV